MIYSERHLVGEVEAVAKSDLPLIVREAITDHLTRDFYDLDFNAADLPTAPPNITVREAKLWGRLDLSPSSRRAIIAAGLFAILVPTLPVEATSKVEP